MTSSSANNRQRWSRQRVVAAIEHRYRTGLSVNAQAVQSDDSRLFSAGRRHFGSWAAALAAAQVPAPSRRGQARYPRGHWSKERVIRAIRNHAHQGEPLHAHAMHQRNNRLIAAATYHFGSWSTALRAAGLDPNSVRATKRRSPSSIVEEIRQLAAKGHDLSAAAARRHMRALHGAAERYFGSWHAAVEQSLD